MNILSRRQRWWLNAWPRRWQIKRHIPAFLKLCPEPFRGEVLEVGAGSGWTSRRILETFPQVELTAIDSDRAAVADLQRIQNHYGQRFRVQQADVSQLPFDRAAFDIVIAVRMLQYVPNVTIAVQQLLRVVRPGGLVGISDVPGKGESGIGRAFLEGVLQQEGCEVIVSQGNSSFVLWARKQYPVAPPSPAATKA